MSIDETKYGMNSDWLKEDSMEDVFKNWNGFLNEGWAGGSFGGTLNPPVYGETPGAAYKAVQEGEVLAGWDKYMQLVAEAYAAAPESTSEGEKAFKALRGHIDNNFDRLESRVKVKFVDGQPYKNAEEMKGKVAEEGELQISRDFNQAGFLGAKRNLKFRAIHDWYAHMKATTKPGASMIQFGLKGELQAYNAHLNFIGKNAEALPALFTEVVGQVCHQSYFGDFPEQKIVTLPQFDFKKIGAVEGYQIVDRELQGQDDMEQLKEYFYSFLPMVNFRDRTYNEVTPPALPIEEVLQSWVEDDLKAYSQLSMTALTSHHVLLPTKEVCKSMNVDTELGYPGGQPERVRRRRKVVADGEIRQPVIIALGKNGRAAITFGKKDLLAAFDAGLKEVPVVFEYHTVV